jgi:hypothetical protein
LAIDRREYSSKFIVQSSKWSRVKLFFPHACSVQLLPTIIGRMTDVKMAVFGGRLKAV